MSAEPHEFAPDETLDDLTEGDDPTATDPEPYMPANGVIISGGMLSSPADVVRALVGMPIKALTYELPKGDSKTVVGLSVHCARALMAACGDLETVTMRHEMGWTYIGKPAGLGKVEVEKAPAVRALVRIRNLANNVTFAAVVDEPLVKYRSDKTSEYFVEQAAQIALAKAERNCVLKHAAGVAPVLLRIIQMHKQAHAIYMSGNILPELEAATDEREGAWQERTARYEPTVGLTKERDVRETLDALETAYNVEAGKLRRELKEFMARTWPRPSGRPMKVADIPQRDAPRLDEWLARLQETLESSSKGSNNGGNGDGKGGET